MHTTDLFEEFGATAAEYGWEGLGQPQSHVRRYGKAIVVPQQGRVQVTVSVYANTAGTGIYKALRTTVDVNGTRTSQHLGSRDGRKRDTVIEWLRGVR